MPHTRFSMSALTVSLLLAAGVLAGCGGGGAAPANEDNASVFAVPSGPLCAVKTDGICIEPTSSSATPQQLIAVLRDPQGPEVQLSRYGSLFTSHTHTRFTAESGYHVDESAFGYDSMEKPILIGGNRIRLDEKTYAFSKTREDGAAEFSAGGNDVITITPPSADEPATSLMQLHNDTSVAGGPANLSMRTDATVWHSFFGLLTDRGDANVPAGGTIQYRGNLSFKGGDGTPLSSPYLNTVEAVCPITLTLHTFSGKLTSSVVHCTDRGTDLNLSLQDLNIKDSRVYWSLGNEAVAGATGPAYAPAADPEATPPTVTVNFSSSRIAGAIYGSGAGLLVIHGSGPSGSFVIGALRQ